MTRRRQPSPATRAAEWQAVATTTAAGYDPPHDIGLLVGFAFRALAEQHGILLEKAGLQGIRPAHGYIFRALVPDGATLTELVEVTQVSKQAVNQILDELERMQLVVRIPDPRDGRAKVVRLTTAGGETLKTISDCWKQLEDEWCQLVGPDDVPTVRRTLGAYLAAQPAWGRGERMRYRPVW